MKSDRGLNGDVSSDGNGKCSFKYELTDGQSHSVAAKTPVAVKQARDTPSKTGIRDGRPMCVKLVSNSDLHKHYETHRYCPLLINRLYEKLQSDRVEVNRTD